jgi:hypothetical protein
MKEILLNFWKAVVKHLLSKTTLDEEIAAKANEINELDEEKPKKTKTKKQK